MKYVLVFIDRKNDYLDRGFWYSCDDDKICKGALVKVPFGASKGVKGFVLDIRDDIEDFDKSKIKSIDEILDISITSEMLKTADWMRNRYAARFIDILNLFVPSGNKPKRDTIPNLEKYITKDKFNEITLNSDQQGVVDEFISSEDTNFLLEGVTGSGKTAVYIELIKRTLKDGKKAIILVPEIALTKQLIERCVFEFSHERIAVIHSRLTRVERCNQWNKIRNGDVDIVIGARSAIFAPLDNIGLIILDEEHEATYKSDSYPYYETVDIAGKRVLNSNGKMLLGSATPSIVSRYRASEKVFHHLKLEDRVNGGKLPNVEIIDMNEEVSLGNLTNFSKKLIDSIKSTFEKNMKVLLFINRRGYTTLVKCLKCKNTLVCPNCDISLTTHNRNTVGVCHFCGYREKIERTCKECGSSLVSFQGFGTEKIQEEIQKIFPERRVERLDLDIMSKKGQLNKILNDFEKDKIDILVGTQIVSKGLDFKNVGLVGIVLADTTLNISDFRAGERTFQLITQTSGRSGRGEDDGNVVLQTFLPDDPSIFYGSKHDYMGYYNYEIENRKKLLYPPFSNIVRISFLGKDEKFILEVANKWYDNVKENSSKDMHYLIYRPVPNHIYIREDRFYYQIFMKVAISDRKKLVRYLWDLKKDFMEIYKNDRDKFTILINVDPYSSTSI